MCCCVAGNNADLYVNLFKASAKHSTCFANAGFEPLHRHGRTLAQPCIKFLYSMTNMNRSFLNHDFNTGLSCASRASVSRLQSFPVPWMCFSHRYFLTSLVYLPVHYPLDGVLLTTRPQLKLKPASIVARGPKLRNSQ